MRSLKRRNVLIGDIDQKKAGKDVPKQPRGRLKKKLRSYNRQ